MKLVSKLAALAVVAATSSAFAAGVGPGTYSNNVPLGTLAYAGFLPLPQYDAATFGPLLSVTLTLKADVLGNVKYESLDASPSTVNITLAGTAQLSKPGGGVIVTSLPTFNDTQGVTAFDGAIDFAGASGNSFAGLNASDTQMGSVLAVDFPLFVGLSDVSIGYAFSSGSGATGPGNIITQIMTQGSIVASVTYVAVPEPTALGLLAPAGLMLARRRRA